MTRAFRRPFAKPQSCDASSMLGPLQVVVAYLKHELVRWFRRFVAYRDLHGKKQGSAARHYNGEKGGGEPRKPGFRNDLLYLQ